MYKFNIIVYIPLHKCNRFIICLIMLHLLQTLQCYSCDEPGDPAPY